MSTPLEKQEREELIETGGKDELETYIFNKANTPSGEINKLRALYTKMDIDNIMKAGPDWDEKEDAI
ncbi:MAG: hypothetical protein EZS28_012597 [Streblomastix strix]|uniref:Uncharacterized protein n=1 Tax=Streblomastix strix TaxID=222440 RepID=A0A5J4WAA8_9EUKA|nr:MAG: hypothetical protein EZS28_012597 [Streblomastix strix]